MRILVCGGREFDDEAMMDAAIRRAPTPTLVISGAQRKWHRTKHKWIGADWQAIEWAQRNEIPFLGIPAKWTERGDAAGPMRNQEMLDRMRPDYVVSLPGGDGTADMVRRAKAAGVQVVEIGA